MVDYSSFFPMVQELLSKCASEASEDRPKFRLTLEEGGNGATLSFQEVNPFR